MAVSDRLKTARVSLKLTLQAVEEQTEIGVSTLSEFENGKREPRLVQLKQLADVYLRPLGFFLEDGAPVPQVVLWRKKPESPRAEEVQARLVKLAEQYHHLEVLCTGHEPCALPFHGGGPAGFSYAQAEKLAHQFRQLLGLGERPGQALLRVLEEVCKVKVFHFDFEPSGGAACTLSESFGAAVLLNAKHVRWRRNFDLAHELFHLLTWKTFRGAGDASAVEATDWEEKLATCFARNLLMPSEVLRVSVDEALAKHGDRLTFDDLFEVARQFDVSVEAVVRQIGFVYHKAADWANSALERFGNQIGFWESRASDAPLALPVRYQALARQALRKGLLSAGKYAEYTGVSRRQAMQIVEQDAGDDASFEVANP
ncbi:MAG TPA: XRE family transcriptional regulator [Gemmataceae bacterium]|nr:XRE family transcriptional regulator [Gemmataceae bacterium]